VCGSVGGTLYFIANVSLIGTEQTKNYKILTWAKSNDQKRFGNSATRNSISKTVACSKVHGSNPAGILRRKS
jgi:hypothetical protein